MARGRDHGRDREGGGGAQDRSDIVGVGDLVEHQHDAGSRQIGPWRRGQGIGLDKEALMHGVRRKPCRDGIGPHQFGLDGKPKAFLGEPP